MSETPFSPVSLYMYKKNVKQGTAAEKLEYITASHVETVNVSVLTVTTTKGQSEENFYENVLIVLLISNTIL